MATAVRRRGQGVLGLLVLGAALLVPTPAAAFEPSDASVTMLSEGAYVASGAQLFTTANADIDVRGNREVVHVSVSGGTAGDEYTIDLAAPPGEELAPGHYDAVQRHPFNEGGHPGLDISGSGRGCNTVSGRFDIRDIVFDGDRVVALDAYYEHYCGADSLNGGALVGEVRVNAPSTQSVDVSPRAMWFPPSHVGAARSVLPVFVTATEPLNLGSATLEGPHAGDWTIREDGCAGRRLAVGEHCRVYLRMVPAGAGPRVAQLVLSDSSGARIDGVPLDATGMGGTTRLHMDSQEGDYIGQGETWTHDVTDGADIGASGTRQHISAGVTDGSTYWSLAFSPPDGDILAAGTTYSGARRDSFSGTAPGLSVSGNGRGCNKLSGSFTVDRLDFDPSGNLATAQIDFVQRCDGGPELRGTLQYLVAGPDTTPPAAVSGITSSVDGDEVVIAWDDPSGDHALTLLRRLVGTSPPPATVSGLLMLAGTEQGLRLSLPDAPQALSWFSVDPAGNVGPVVSRILHPDGRLSTAAPPADPDDGSQPEARRLAGADRYATAIEVSQASVSDGDASAVVLARGDDYPDALAGTPLAIAEGAPLLLTPPDELLPEVATEIDRVLGDDGHVLVLGGPLAVADGVVERLRADGHAVQRIAGADRFATARAIAARLGDPTTVLLADGRNFPDALAAGPAAAQLGAAVLLTDGSASADSTVAYLEDQDTSGIAIGGPAARAHPDVRGLVGADRHATAALVADAYLPDARRAGLARSHDFPDALAGGVLMGRTGAPLVLTRRDTLVPAAADLLCGRAPMDALVTFGGPVAISDAVASQAAARAGGTGC